jgi:hypothetical protein
LTSTFLGAALGAAAFLTGAALVTAFLAATLTGAAFLAKSLAAGLADFAGVFTTTGFFTTFFATALGDATVLAAFLAGTGFLEAVFLDLAFTVGLLAASDSTGVLAGSGARDCSHNPQGFINLAKSNKIHQTKD